MYIWNVDDDEVFKSWQIARLTSPPQPSALPEISLPLRMVTEEYVDGTSRAARKMQNCSPIRGLYLTPHSIRVARSLRLSPPMVPHDSGR